MSKLRKKSGENFTVQKKRGNFFLKLFEILQGINLKKIGRNSKYFEINK